MHFCILTTLNEMKNLKKNHKSSQLAKAKLGEKKKPDAPAFKYKVILKKKYGLCKNHVHTDCHYQ